MNDHEYKRMTSTMWNEAKAFLDNISEENKKSASIALLLAPLNIQIYILSEFLYVYKEIDDTQIWIMEEVIKHEKIINEQLPDTLFISDAPGLYEFRKSIYHLLK